MDTLLNDAELARLEYFKEPGLVTLIGNGTVPPVRNQGNLAACVHFALCAMLSTILAAANICFGVFSPQHLVDTIRVKFENDEGELVDRPDVAIPLELGLLHLKNDGALSEVAYPYRGHRTELEGYVEPTEGIRGFMELCRYTPFGAKEEVTPITLEEVYEELDKGRPVLGAIYITEEFLSFVGEGIYSHGEDAHFVLSPSGHRAGHYMLITGHHKEKGYLLVQNTAGPGSGFHGFMKVDASCLSLFAFAGIPTLVTKKQLTTT